MREITCNLRREIDKKTWFRRHTKKTFIKSWSPTFWKDMGHRRRLSGGI